MSFVENLEALERGEMKYSGLSGDTDADDDVDADVDTELDPDVETDPEVKEEVEDINEQVRSSYWPLKWLSIYIIYRYYIDINPTP